MSMHSFLRAILAFGAGLSAAVAVFTIVGTQNTDTQSRPDSRTLLGQLGCPSDGQACVTDDDCCDPDFGACPTGGIEYVCSDNVCVGIPYHCCGNGVCEPEGDSLNESCSNCSEDCGACGGDPVCGDGDVEGDEQCDDGNTDNGDGCDSNCIIEACGNGVVQSGEECDDGDTDNGDGCDSNCVVEECGNSVIQSGEQCDDGNTDNGDGCDSECQTEDEEGPVCGDGDLEGDEECDDGNTSNGDGCSSTCDTEGVDTPLCNNDGICGIGEDCNVCKTDCGVCPICNNGTVESGEECDFGEDTDCCVSCVIANEGQLCNRNAEEQCTGICNNKGACIAPNPQLEVDDFTLPDTKSLAELADITMSGVNRCPNDGKEWEASLTVTAADGYPESTPGFPKDEEHEITDVLMQGDTVSFVGVLPPSAANGESSLASKSWWYRFFASIFRFVRAQVGGGGGGPNPNGVTHTITVTVRDDFGNSGTGEGDVLVNPLIAESGVLQGCACFEGISNCDVHIVNNGPDKLPAVDATLTFTGMSYQGEHDGMGPRFFTGLDNTDDQVVYTAGGNQLTWNNVLIETALRKILEVNRDIGRWPDMQPTGQTGNRELVLDMPYSIDPDISNNARSVQNIAQCQSKVVDPPGPLCAGDNLTFVMSIGYNGANLPNQYHFEDVLHECIYDVQSFTPEEDCILGDNNTVICDGPFTPPTKMISFVARVRPDCNRCVQIANQATATFTDINGPLPNVTQTNAVSVDVCPCDENGQPQCNQCDFPETPSAPTPSSAANSSVGNSLSSSTSANSANSNQSEGSNGSGESSDSAGSNNSDGSQSSGGSENSDASTDPQSSESSGESDSSDTSAQSSSLQTDSSSQSAESTGSSLSSGATSSSTSQNNFSSVVLPASSTASNGQSSSASQGVCPVDACAEGGDQFCASQNLPLCIPIADQPCVRCDRARNCTSDSDCPNGTRCNAEEGICVTDCLSDDHCSDGLICQSGLCTIPECTGSSECAAGEQCENGRCLQDIALIVEQPIDPSLLECEADSDCSADEYCRDGMCYSTICRSDSDCLDEEQCLVDSCVPLCASDNDCPDSYQCNLSSGRCTPLCLSDEQCGAAQQCIDGQCINACRNNTDCPSEYACQASRCILTSTIRASFLDLPFEGATNRAAGSNDVLPPENTETGPGVVIAVMGAGAAAGYAWVRRRRPR